MNIYVFLNKNPIISKKSPVIHKNGELIE